MIFTRKFIIGIQLYCLLPFRNILTETILNNTNSSCSSASFSTISSLNTTTESSSKQNILNMTDKQQHQSTFTSASSSSSPHEAGGVSDGLTSVAFVTTPDENSAKKIAHGIISQKLAACVNIIPNLTSVYFWEGKINEDSEILLMIKTKTNRIDELTKFVRENHPYSVAEVITLPIQNGNPPYLDWIMKTVPDKK